MKEPFGIHWFRRDLRIAANIPLENNRALNRGRTLGIFFLDRKFLNRPDFSVNRFGFFLRTLRELKAELNQVGGDLLVLERPPLEGFQSLFELFKSLQLPLPRRVSFCRDYEPFARSRDAAITTFLEDLNIPVMTDRDHLLVEPNEIQKPNSKNSSGFYQIYTPFFKRWHELLEDDIGKQRIQIAKQSLSYLKKIDHSEDVSPLFKVKWRDLLGTKAPEDQLKSYLEKNQPLETIEIPPAGSLAAYKRMNRFKASIDDYANNRDIPAVDGTSQLSIYLKNGSITTSMIIAALSLDQGHKNEKDSKFKFLKELAWREFYYHILYHQPRVENEAFLKQLNHLKWENNETYFQAWTEGRTGFPIIDAGMRQLKQTGWMHNRVRMIVASFLTKDLLIDWKWGEKYFMNHLLDGDLAPNNGGWQWAASTGCDPQPYFRIFNPVLQSKKFDPEGIYIKKFVPELRFASQKEIHAPELTGSTKQYPAPIVDHTKQKAKALALYRNSSLKK